MVSIVGPCAVVLWESWQPDYGYLLGLFWGIPGDWVGTLNPSQEPLVG